VVRVSDRVLEDSIILVPVIVFSLSSSKLLRYLSNIWKLVMIKSSLFSSPSDAAS